MLKILKKLFVGELILVFLKYLLKLNIKIGQKLTYLIARYEARNEIEEVIESGKFDMRGISERFKNVIIHDEDVINRRWDICKACPELTASNRCKKCGCFMKAGDKFVKIRLATARCPIGKWEKEYEFIKGQAVNGTRVTTEL